MGKTVNDRVIDLLKTLKMSETEAAAKVNKQPATLYRIVKKEVTPSTATLKLLADALGANYDWLNRGEGEMMASVTPNSGSIDPWANALVKEVKEENTRLQQELSRVWAIVNHLTGGKIPSFNSAATVTGAKVYYLPGKHFEASAVA